MTSTLFCICSQIKKAKESCSLGIVTHMSLGMADFIAQEVYSCEETERIATLKLMAHSTMIDVDSPGIWLLTLAR